MRTGHPLFFNQLYARADPVSIVGDWLAVAANTNVHTYEVSRARSAPLQGQRISGRLQVTYGLMLADMLATLCPRPISTSPLAIILQCDAQADTCLNAWSGTVQVAPVFTAVEVEVLAKLARCVGGEFARQHDGLFCPGGSISNMYGEVRSECCRLQPVMQ